MRSADTEKITRKNKRNAVVVVKADTYRLMTTTTTTTTTIIEKLNFESSV